MTINKILRDEKFFKNLEAAINKEIKDLNSNTGSYNPFNVWCPPYAEGPNSYQQEIVDYHIKKGKALPKGFWKKDEGQLKGMYFGIFTNSFIKKYRYRRLIEETCEEFKAPLNPQLKKDMKLGKIEGDKLKETYSNLKDACESIIEYYGPEKAPVGKNQVYSKKYLEFKDKMNNLFGKNN